MKKITTFLFVLLSLFCQPAKADNYERNLKYAAQNSVKAKLKDPDSAKFGVIYVVYNVACGSVNAKNSYGGYSGSQRFLSAGKPELTFMEKEVDPDDFAFIWDTKCRS